MGFAQGRRATASGRRQYPDDRPKQYRTGTALKYGSRLLRYTLFDRRTDTIGRFASAYVRNEYNTGRAFKNIRRKSFENK